MAYEQKTNDHGFIVKCVSAGAVLFASVLALAMAGCPAYNRYQAWQDGNLERTQARLNAANTVQVNETIIQQTQQLVQVEQQKAQIRVVEAEGIAKAQQIINATLTDRYLQHEAIGVQEKVAASANHSDTFYIPSGQNGIPLVKTLDKDTGTAVQK